MSIVIKDMTEGMPEEKLTSGEEMIPVPQFSKENLTRVVKFYELIDYDNDLTSVLKTKPILPTI
jgi:hypothetical protein